MRHTERRTRIVDCRIERLALVHVHALALSAFAGFRHVLAQAVAHLGHATFSGLHMRLGIGISTQCFHSG